MATITDLIAEIKISVQKQPKVPNYDNLVEMIPSLERYVEENGDFEFDPEDLEKFLLMKRTFK